MGKSKTLGDDVQSVKAGIKKGAQATSRVVRNGEQFVQAVALITVAVFAYTQLHVVKSEALKWFVAGSLAVIALRGMYEFFSFLNKEK